MTRRRIVTGDEQDAYTRWRKVYCWTKRAGAVKKVKRRTHRRERREARAEIEREARDAMPGPHRTRVPAPTEEASRG